MRVTSNCIRSTLRPGIVLALGLSRRGRGNELCVRVGSRNSPRLNLNEQDTCLENQRSAGMGCRNMASGEDGLDAEGGPC